jgi:hypothetical protein
MIPAFRSKRHPRQLPLPKRPVRESRSFHARPDFGATDAGALVRAMPPSEFADQAAGNARAVLAKAEPWINTSSPHP